MEKNDLLRKFKETTEQQQQQQQQPGIESRKEQEGELNLGLSLGGCFGVKPKNETSSSLFRSASTSEACLTAAFMKEEVEDVPLTRTSSLPSETLDSRKRKGIPSMEQLDSKKRVGGGEAWSFKPNWGFSGQGNPLLRASHGSQGSGSSTNSFLESLSAQGSSNHRGPRSPASVLPLPEQMEQKPTVKSFSENAKPDVATGSEKVNSLERPDAMRNCTKESEAKVMEDMPCVFTKGVGPNGKRIEGLLFKYKKGEDLRIVCVCHGTFLTPAEFVKHAGGGEVAHPLRHIVVAAPSLSSFS